MERDSVFCISSKFQVIMKPLVYEAYWVSKALGLQCELWKRGDDFGDLNFPVNVLESIGKKAFGAFCIKLLDSFHTYFDLIQILNTGHVARNGWSCCRIWSHRSFSVSVTWKLNLELWRILNLSSAQDGLRCHTSLEAVSTSSSNVVVRFFNSPFIFSFLLWSFFDLSATRREWANFLAYQENISQPPPLQIKTKNKLQIQNLFFSFLVFFAEYLIVGSVTDLGSS